MRSRYPWQTRSSRESQCAAPPSEPERRERHRGFAEAWRTCPAGAPGRNVHILINVGVQVGRSR
eukprot:6313079-Alexandrium_andersonii.AAC.1